MNLSVESIVTGQFQENSYFFWNNDSFDTILIDPGDDEDLISKALDKKNLVPIAIVNTHAHLDHIGAIRQLKTKYDIPFYLHENESLILDSYEETCELFGMEKKQKPEVDIWLRDEVEIKINNFKLELIRAPGHTPGGICIKIENHLFVGDIYIISIDNEYTNKPFLYKIVALVEEDFTVHFEDENKSIIVREKNIDTI